MTRIICIGNPFIPQDCAGYKVFQHLSKVSLPENMEVIDGGLGGLNLLRFFDDAQHVIFIDNVVGYDCPEGFVVLTFLELLKLEGKEYDHNTGLIYLFRILPEIYGDKMPRTELVGINGIPDEKKIDRITSAVIDLAAQKSQNL